MIHELPWLAAATQADRDELRQLDMRDPVFALAHLRALSERRWNNSEFNAIGRKLRKINESFGRAWREKTKDEGFLPLSLLILSSGTVTHLVEPLMAAALMRGIVLDCRVSEYQEPEAWLAGNGERIATSPPDIALISMNREALHLSSPIGNAVEADNSIRRALDRLIMLSKRLSDLGARSVLIENLPAQAIDARGSTEAWLPGSASSLTDRFNHYLAEAKAKHPFVLFDVASIANLVGQSAWQPGRYRYMAGMSFSPECAPLYALRFVNLIAALFGKSRRVLVLDLDNTLWGGVIGDDGVEGIVLGGNSVLGKVYQDIQRAVREYAGRGILLCVASKNTREIALDAFRRHPEMILVEGDITIFEIHWNSKVESIRAMSEALNLGLEAFVFLDDNPVERKQVRDSLPGVAAPELPTDPTAWLTVFQAAAYFEQQNFSEEDLKRGEFYRGNVGRASMRNSSGDESSFLQSLQMKMQIAPFEPIGRQRVAQLIAKSNQFNLTTRRYSEAQVATMEEDSALETLQIRLSDIFGDNGMICVVICRKSPKAWEIDTWLMSCRVLGRRVEQAVLNILAERARKAGALELHGSYIATPKNGIVKDHYEKLGFSRIQESEPGENRWFLRLSDFTPAPVPMEITEVRQTQAAVGLSA